MRKKWSWVLGAVGLLCLGWGNAFAQATVSNLVVAQRPGTRLVDISYDVASAGTPVVYVSLDIHEGATPIAANSLTGDIGLIPPGTGKAIVWDMGTDWTESYAELSFTLKADAPIYMVVDLSRGPSASSYPVSYLDAVPAGGWTDEYKTTKLVMRKIPSGSFTMGSPTNELGRTAEREAQRQVTLTKDMYMGVFEVTQKQWERVMGDWPSWFNNASFRDSRPVEQRSWNDIRGGTWPGGQPGAGTFMQRISVRTGQAFDLPTEAQWEYACRAGTTTALNSGQNLTNTTNCPNMSVVGRYYYNHPGGYSSSSSVSTDGGTAKVGSYLPNAWGLYDMHGNVWEWCLDWYAAAPPGTVDPVGAASGSYRLLRGGSWLYLARYCRSAYRIYNTPGYRDGGSGFRPSRTLP